MAPNYATDSPSEVVEHLPFWDDWSGDLTRNSRLALLINLGIIALGIAVSMKRNTWRGLFPLPVFLTYSLGNALVRSSGWRFNQPADWIILAEHAVARLTMHPGPWTIVHGLLFPQKFLYTYPYSIPNGESMDKRMGLDFEIDFSNGGGLEGQDFRLDIERDDISDQELADHIVRDMRLLMVQEVRILKKEIITETHTRQRDQSSTP